MKIKDLTGKEVKTIIKVLEESTIMMYLIDLREKINAKRHLSDEQIEEIAFEVVNSFYHFTIADIHVVFRRAKLGEYGEFYESIDMPKVMSWFKA